jgi:HK97 family phage prohead protease
MEYKTLSFETKSVTGFEFSGYASTHDLDRGGDIVLPGAFAKSLERSGGEVVLQWQHQSDTPIGLLKAGEDQKGLAVDGRISETTQGKDAAILLKDRVIRKMSIGYITRKAEDGENGTRLLKEVDLLEVSLVTHPMNEAAVITQVKSLTPKEIERVLREAGLSKSQAACIASAGIRSLREADNSDELKAVESLLAEMRQLTQILRN